MVVITAGIPMFRVQGGLSALEIGDLKNTPRVQLTGHIHPTVRSAEDLGTLDPSRKLSVAVVFGRSAIMPRSAASNRTIRRSWDGGARRR